MDFKSQVIKIISAIPKGKVMSYGQVASMAGSPKAARQVGAVLRGVEPNSKIPWWRVINNKGEISIKGNWIATKELQKKLLEKEGVIIDSNFSLDINKYRYEK
jgi:methylated-DNA-protein-cysteine methyltransferase-like protein